MKIITIIVNRGLMLRWPTHEHTLLQMGVSFRILVDFNLVVRVSACGSAIINNHSILIILYATVNTWFWSNRTPSSEGKRQNIVSRPTRCSSCGSAAPTTTVVNTSVSLGLKCLYYAQASKGQRSRDSVSDPETQAQTWQTYTERARAYVIGYAWARSLLAAEVWTLPKWHISVMQL